MFMFVTFALSFSQAHSQVAWQSPTIFVLSRSLEDARGHGDVNFDKRYVWIMFGLCVLCCLEFLFFGQSGAE